MSANLEKAIQEELRELTRNQRPKIKEVSGQIQRETG